MFVVRDRRKIAEILQDPEDPRTQLKLARREAELGGTTNVLLDPSTGTKLQNVETLSLYGNKLHSLSHLEVLAANASKLREIALGNNMLRELGDAFGEMTALQRFSAEDNYFDEFPRPLFHCTSLKSIRLSNNKIFRLPRSIGHLTALEELALDNNQLTELPSQLCSLPIKTLVLRGNGLTSLPAQLGDMASLEDLQVSSNALVELPASIGGCKALRRLIVNSNQLEALPAGLADCPKLARVNAANNRIKRLPLELVDAFEPSFAPGIAAAARRVAELGDDGGSDGRDVEGGAGAGAGAAPAPRKIEIELSSNPIEAMAADIASGASSEPAAKKPRAE